ncbi:class II fructose-bisphosphate aldolase [Nocardioides bruguierae]|uniref:class II fructose-bisphosphate aldolase n=1 Tax=Nocardioides bruguierae TaxID=2945102 RepID=UPI0020204152|nr:class II fructose-bisphosphate aldolase [Nocardioides bruguierae]MCL8024519.1 class II fructose-bisphosphate aldolase [Nocardioides bruguierae]
MTAHATATATTPADLAGVVSARLAAGGAVTAVACYDFSTALATVTAAEERKRPVILLVPPVVAAEATGLRLVRALRGLADGASVPVVVQLDHARDPDLIEATVDAGAHAVLADGSHLSLADNAAFVASVIARLPEGTCVEAELGALAGDEDRTDKVSHVPAGMTDPADVAVFLERSGAHLLAVSIGNAHGNYVGDPHLDWELLARIREVSDAAGVPLVLHGASGLPRADLAAAPRRGIGKVNVNTEVRQELLAKLGSAVPAAVSSGANVRGLVAAWRGQVGETVGGFLDLLDP